MCDFVLCRQRWFISVTGWGLGVGLQESELTYMQKEG